MPGPANASPSGVSGRLQIRAGRSVLYSRYAAPLPSTNGLGSIAPVVPHSSGPVEPSTKGPVGAALDGDRDALAAGERFADRVVEDGPARAARARTAPRRCPGRPTAGARPSALPAKSHVVRFRAPGGLDRATGGVRGERDVLARPRAARTGRRSRTAAPAAGRRAWSSAVWHAGAAARRNAVAPAVSLHPRPVERRAAPRRGTAAPRCVGWSAPRA